MQAHEQADFLRAVSLYIREQVVQSTQPLLIKIEELEAQIAERPIIDEGDLVELTSDAVTAVIKSIPQPKDGKDADLTQVKELIDGKAKEQLKLFVQDIDFRFKKYDEAIFNMVNEGFNKFKDGKDGKDGVDGKDALVDYEIVRENIDELVTSKLEEEIKKFSVVDGKDGIDGAPGKDGKDGADGKEAIIPWDYLNEQLSCGMGLLSEQLKKNIEALPKPKDGKDGKDGKDAEIPVDWITSMVEKNVANYFDNNPIKDGAPGRDGKDVDWDLVKDQLANELNMIHGDLRKYVDDLPKPKDGANGKDGIDGKNGLDAVSFFRDNKGNLNVTMSNGSIYDLGQIDGKDGVPGKDGKDGVGFPHINMEQIDERHFELVITNEDKTQERRCQFELRQQVYRDVWKQGKYERDDRVTWNGSEWIALRDTETAPGTVNSDWRLTVKCGRDGRKGDQGPPGTPGKNGENGRDGRDLTQMGFDGKKW